MVPADDDGLRYFIWGAQLAHDNPETVEALMADSPTIQQAFRSLYSAQRALLEAIRGDRAFQERLERLLERRT